MHISTTSHFVTNLRKEVPRKLGRPEYCEIWMDFKLAGADRITPEIEIQLRAAHTFVLFMSKGWLASKWCQRELAIAAHSSHRSQ